MSTKFHPVAAARSRIKSAAVSALVIGLVPFGLLFLALTIVPRWILDESIRRNGQPVPVSDRINAENDVRMALVQAVGGLVVALGAWTAWRQLQATQKRDREELRLTREAQITDRFTRAIDQLASSTLAGRLGGIYALGRIARESARDHWPIIEVLTAYIRENASWNGARDASSPPEVQAIANVLREREWAHEAATECLELPDVNMGYVNLRGAFLFRANLQRTNLLQANLFQANLAKAELEGASLHCAKAEGAVLADAQLYCAHLEGANLQGANLKGSKLKKAVLIGADLRNADLRDALFFETDLSGADLRGANLSETDPGFAELSCARWDETTVWPGAFDPKPFSTQQSDGSWTVH